MSHVNDMIISPQTYDAVEQWCHEVVSSPDHQQVLYDSQLFQKTLQQSSQRFQFPMAALQSLIRNISVIHIKKTAPAVKRQLPQYLQLYKQGTSILALAQQAHYSAYLLARYIVEETTSLKGRKKLMSEAMRDPETILGWNVLLPEYHAAEEHKPTKVNNSNTTTTRLAFEIREAMNADSMYGPLHDKERHMVGVEYEVVLEQELLALGIPFETEAKLRELGTARTPDILLSCPLSVKVPAKDGSNDSEWKLICWVDSKACFGDVHTHQTSVLPQAESYLHRFGAGLILYWFGHAPLERLGNAQGEIVICSSDLPDSIMWPTGELVVQQQKDKSLI